MMEEISDTPAKVTNDNTACIEKTQDENIPINDNSTFHISSNPLTIDSNQKNSDDHNANSSPGHTIENNLTQENDEDLEEGEIDDEDEEESPKDKPGTHVVATVDLTKSKNSQESSENSDHSDANLKRRTDEESEPSDNGKKNGERECDSKKDRKSRREKRSDRDLRKELQDDEAKKREIKEKIRALEMQMKMDEDDAEDEEDLEEMGILGVGGSPRENRKQRKRKSESDSNNEIDQDRGERVKQDIAMLSPMQRPSGNETGITNENSMALESSNKNRPEDLNIKSFVPSKPLPVPTPSRESTLTQKLELALGMYFVRK